MAKNKPTKQHYVPECYLRGWVDPKTPAGQEPYVWIFNRGEKKGRKKAPSNIFTETDLYTLRLKTGEKDYAIEETLSNLEGRYANIFKNKIQKHLPLNEEEHITLCVFVAAMLQRTPRYRDNMERFHNELIEHTEAMEKAHDLNQKESEKMKEFKQNSHRMSIIQMLPAITEMLIPMSIAFLCVKGGSRFVTSDDPCNLFNPDLQFQIFYGPGLGQKNVQVTLPLSPEIALCMSWSPLRGYAGWSNDEVEELNRMVVGHCYKYFVSHSSKVRHHWFRRYPLDFFFIMKIIRNQVEMRWCKLKNWYQYGRHVKRKRT